MSRYHAMLDSLRAKVERVRKELVCVEAAVYIAQRAEEDPGPPPDADPIPATIYNLSHQIEVGLFWNWAEGYHGDPDTPDDPPYLEDVTVMLGEHDITDLLPADVLADVREAMLRDMEASQ